MEVAEGVGEAKPSGQPDAPSATDAPNGSATLVAADGGSGSAAEPAGPPLFEEFYDDWEAFDQAVASAVAKYHPIRKRSSLTFDVYNRTVSKGKHDRRSIAEFLSKTFKCTHGIKFRPRSNGKRSRHKLRDIGCPFHLYASAVEYGPTYRVKVRVNATHNHVIGPDAIKAVSSMRGANGELLQGASALPTATSASPSATTVDVDASTLAQAAPPTAAASLTLHRSIDHLNASVTSSFAHQATPGARSSQAHAQTEALNQAFAQAHAQALVRAQEHAHALSHARVQAMLQSHHAQTSAALEGQSHHESNQQTHGSGSASTSELLDSSGHDSETLLARAIESTMDDEVFISSGPASAVPASVSSTSSAPSSSDETTRPAPKFEPTLTLEALRRRVADIADERDWNQASGRCLERLLSLAIAHIDAVSVCVQLHTPRNLLLALTGEVGELCEIFQWKGECASTDDWSAEEKAHLSEELSDVMIYLVRLADKCNVDLPAALSARIAKNGATYPAKLVRSSSKKSSQYKRMRLEKESV